MARMAQPLALALLLALAAGAGSPSSRAGAPVVAREELSAEIDQFLRREVASHVGQIATLEPPPKAVHGAGTTGEYTWGTFMRAVAVYAEMSGERAAGGHDLAKLVGQTGLLEHRLGGKQFSQLYA